MKKRKIKNLLLALLLPLSISMISSCGNPVENNSTPIGGIIDRDPFVKSVTIISQPKKTTYFEGDYFEPKGLVFNAVWDIDGEEELIEDMTSSDCDSFSHKNIPLKKEDTKVTYTIGGFSFDISITVNEKVLGQHTVTLTDGTFEGGTNVIPLLEGDKLPNATCDKVGFEGWYYQDANKEFHIITDNNEFSMPDYDITLKPIIFESIACTSRWAGGNTIPPVYNSENNKVAAGTMVSEGDGLSEKRVQYSIDEANTGAKIFGNNGSHVSRGYSYIKWTFTYVSGETMNFDFALDKDNNLFLGIDDITLSKDKAVQSHYIFANNPSQLDGNTRSFVITLRNDLTSTFTFILECSVAKLISD